MTKASLDPLFRPRSIAVIGASEGATATGAPKLGAAVLDHLIAHQYSGKIFPINPRGGVLAGRAVYTTLEQVPDAVDLALIVVPVEACLKAVDDCVAKGVKGAVVFTSGFAETGATDLQDELLRRARAGGLRIVGPNTAGFVNVGEDMIASISMVCQINPFKKGPIAFVTQSGALGGSMLGRGMEEGIGFSAWISTGNEADIDTAEYIDYLLDRPEVKVIALFLEGVRDAKAFLAAAEKATSLRKPIVVYKTGASEVGAAAAASHTGALAGSDRIFDAVCRQFGLVRVEDASMLFPVAMAFALVDDKLPTGRRMAVVSASGGICGVAADECARVGLELPELTDETKARIRAFTPPFASLRNPIDVTGQIRSFATGYQDTVRTVLDEPYIDGALLLVTMAAEPRASFYGREISALVRDATKPVIVAWTGALSVAQKGYPMLSANGVPNFLSVRQAVETMAALHKYRSFLNRRGPPGSSAAAAPGAGLGRDLIEAARKNGQTALSESESRRLLASYGIDVTREVEASSREEAIAAADRLGYPVAVKGCHWKLQHKTEAGAVLLGLRDSKAVGLAFDEIMPKVPAGGSVLVQEMAVGKRELILGMTRDAQFGPCVSLGLGGIFAEVLGDVAFRVAPFDRSEAGAMIDELKGRAVLGAFRGMTPVDRAKIERMLVAMSRIAIDHPSVREIDVNPMIVVGDAPIAVDALVILDGG